MNTGLAIAAAVLFIFYGLNVSMRSRPLGTSWKLYAALSALFFLYSAYTISVEGPLGFWTDHTRNFWGNQIWFDLLLAAGVAFGSIAPRARAVGMKLPIWLLMVVSSGSIGLLAMMARLTYLESQRK